MISSTSAGHENLTAYRGLGLCSRLDPNTAVHSGGFHFC